MSEHTTKITSRAMAIPFQFLCGGLLLPSSWSAGCDWVALAPGVGCCSCFMAVIPLPPASELTLPRGHFTLGDRHLASDRMSQTPRRSRNWRKRKAAAAAVGFGGGGEGERQGGDGERQQKQVVSLFCRIPLFHYRRSSDSPLSPPPHHHPKMQTPDATKWQVSGAAGGWLPAPDRAGAVACNAGGARLSFYRSPPPAHPHRRRPSGLPARCSARQVQQQQ